jgi:hypothetical protein
MGGRDLWHASDDERIGLGMELYGGQSGAANDEYKRGAMRQSVKLLGALGLLLALAGPALAQSGGAGPIGRPQGGGNLPQDFDTLSPAVTAGTTQTQAGATLCTQTICYVGTANSGDGVKLRQCTLAPMRQLLINNSGNSIQVYGSGTDTINGITTTTGITLGAVTSTIDTGTAEFVCAVGGTAAKWFTH